MRPAPAALPRAVRGAGHIAPALLSPPTSESRRPARSAFTPYMFLVNYGPMLDGLRGAGENGLAQKMSTGMPTGTRS